MPPSCRARRAQSGSRRAIRRVLPLLAAVSACATGAPRSGDAATPADPPETLVEVLPRTARLSVDGVALGPGAHLVAIPDALHRYRFRAEEPGFRPAERMESGARLAGARIALVLVPEGLDHAQRLELEDGEALAAAAEILERRGLHQAAVDFADRAAQVAPRAPIVRRVVQELRGGAARGIEVRDVHQPGSAR